MHQSPSSPVAAPDTSIPGPKAVLEDRLASLIKGLKSRPISSADSVLPCDPSIQLFVHESYPVAVLSKDPLRAEFGGKAAGILHLINSGLAVPPSLFVAADVFGDLVVRDSDSSGSRPGLPKNPLQFMGTCRMIRSVLEDLKFTPAVFIRSSSPYEDSIHHTAAGLFASRAAASTGGDDAFEETIGTVLESAFSANAEAFYRKYGISPSPLSLVIQPLQFDSERAEEKAEFAPAYAGTIDTAHPHLIRVSLVRGLGGTIVDGHFCYKVMLDRATLETIAVHGQQRSEQFLASAGDEELQFVEQYVGDTSRLRIEDPAVLAQEVARYLVQRDPSALQRSEEFEFCIPGAVTSPSFLQRKHVRALDMGFSLPTPTDDAVAIAARQFCGQGVSVPLPIYFLTLGGAELETDEQVQQLRNYNARHPEGYILVSYFPEGSSYLRLRAAAERIPYEAFCNARGAAFLSDASEGYRFELSEFSHFSQFFRSEQMPIIALHWQDLIAQPRLTPDMLQRSHSESLRAIVAVDEVRGQGYIAFYP